jgi:hypothetical protein
MKYSGTCLCGAISYRISSELTDVTYCHCSMCRKFSGSAFLAFASARHDAIKIDGLESLGQYSASTSASRQFCKHCGSTMFWHEQGEYGQDYLCVTLGSLDTVFEPTDWQHFYVSCKASWYDVLDGKQEFSETS